jgi:tRNA pseudouridine38-40 synthase
VQDALQAALSSIAGTPVEITGAGRTDRGVHARLQVAHFDTEAKRPPSAWVRGVNALLPDAVAVLWSQEVPDDFHARFSARARTYRYQLLNRPVRPALEAHYLGWFHQPLDVDKMRAAAALFVGEHDFSAFRSSECQAKSPVRTIHEFTIETSKDRIDLVVRANAFLHHMVRNLVGTLVYVGKGKHPPQWARELLDSKDRARAAPTFGPEGLYLERIEYEAKWNLPL